MIIFDAANGPQTQRNSGKPQAQQPGVDDFRRQLLQLGSATGADDAAAPAQRSEAAKPATEPDADVVADDDDDAPAEIGLVGVLLQNLLTLPPRDKNGAMGEAANDSGSATSADSSTTAIAATSGDLLGDMLAAVSASTEGAPAAADPSADGVAAIVAQPIVDSAAALAPANPALDAASLSLAQGTPLPQADKLSMPHNLQAPVPATHSAALADSLGERITWLADAGAKEGIQQARIELHPAEWGSLQIRIDLDRDGNTKVAFDFETPQARKAVEASLPQLRELLSTSVVTGAAPKFELSGGLGQQSQSGHWQAASSPSTSVADDEPASAEVKLVVSRRNGLFDQFA